MHKGNFHSINLQKSTKSIFIYSKTLVANKSITFYKNHNYCFAIIYASCSVQKLLLISKYIKIFTHKHKRKCF